MRRLAELAALAAALSVFAVYALDALLLIRFPWDWSPDEGLALDYARRLVHDPGSLYPRDTVVPFPAAYTPLLPAVLAPFTLHTARPLLAGRLVAAAWTAAIAAAVFVLARKRAPAAMALLAAALSLAPVGFTFWYMLVRVDGLMLALWLWALVPLLPAELRPGGDRLTWPRIAVGSALLLLSVLAKPTAVAHGAPVVLGWLLVDRRGAARLILFMGALGGAVFLALQALTRGGFLWVMGIWNIHPRGDWAQTRAIVLMFVLGAAPLLVWVLASRLARAPSLPWDGAYLMIAGGLLILPATSKYGAWWNYLLPLLCAVAVLGARIWAARGLSLGLALGAAAAFACLLLDPFPLPTAADEVTARSFFSYVQAGGAPLLATRPDYSYYLVGQEVEMEASSFPVLVHYDVVGVEGVLERIKGRRYNTIVSVRRYWPKERDYLPALLSNYALVGGCALGSFYGPESYLLFTPIDRPRPFAYLPGSHCQTSAEMPRGTAEPAAR